MSILAYNDLPERIRDHLKAMGYGAKRFHGGLRTAFKPNDTIPTLWAVLVDDCLLLCSTHKRRGIFRQFRTEDLNAVRVTGEYLEIIPSGAEGIIKVRINPRDMEAFEELASATHKRLCSGLLGFS